MQVLGYEVAALNTVQFSMSSSSPDYSQDKIAHGMSTVPVHRVAETHF